ncbi:MAG: MarR family transcriptional regulator [Meiothermus sp.]|nr:MarR family transcriptional regulator [Meiothermus sp.]
MTQPLEECFIFLLSKANQQVQARARERMVAHGITPTQYAVLRVLWEQDGQSAAELGQRLVLDAATMVGILDRLEQNNLLERRPHPKDRRVNRVHLTKVGRALKQPLNKIVEEINAELEAHFGRDLTKLRRVLAELGGVERETVSSER